MHRDRVALDAGRPDGRPARAHVALAGASAQDTYPTRPIRLVVGFGAGGPTDIPARFIADKLGDALGQRVIVENKPAAAGMLATRDVLSQPARRLHPAALHALRIDQHRRSTRTCSSSSAISRRSR